MPTYRVTDPQSGRSLNLTGDTAPTAEELEEIFSSHAGPRVAPVQRSERSLNEERWRDLGQTDPLYPPKEAATMSGPQRALTALDYGLENTAYGLAQLGAHAMPGVDPSGIDATVRDRAESFQQGGLSDYTGASLAGMAGEAAGLAAPGGLAVKGVRAVAALPRIAMPMLEGGAAGAAEGLSMPAVGEDYLGEKAAQTGAGAGLGAGIAGGLQGLLGGGEALVNVPRQAANLPGELAGRRANTPYAQQGAQLQAQTGVQMTPGQASGSPALRFMEQRARESLFSTNRVMEGDLVRAGQFKSYVEGVAGNVNSAEFANNLQGRVTNFVRDLAGQRSKTGRQMYGEIDRMANGAKIVQPRNLYDELNTIIKEAGSQEGGDVVAAAKQARAMLDTIDGQGGYSAQEALGRLQNYSPHSLGNVFDDVSKGYDQVLKGRVYRALMKDLDETAAQGGTIGDMVKGANAQWRTYSEQITAIQKSALGKMVGDEYATDLMNFNSVAPEKVMDGFMSLRPSQAQYVAKFLEENMPDQLPQLRGSILNDAIDAAMEVPPTGGAQLNMNPAGFLRALGLTGGERGGEAMLRLQALFGGEKSVAWGQVRGAIEVARRMADAHGKNFSGTSQANQFYSLMKAFGGHLSGALKTMGSTAMEAAGLHRIADSMDPASALYGNLNRVPLLRAPRVITASQTPLGVLGTGAAISGNQPQY